MLRIYGVDLRDLVSDEGGLSPRRALVLIEGLPYGCRSWAHIQGDPELEGWDISTYMLAGLLDSVRENTFATVQIQSKKKLKPPEPIKIPGASAKPAKKPNLFAQMAAAQFNRKE